MIYFTSSAEVEVRSFFPHVTRVQYDLPGQFFLEAKAPALFVWCVVDRFDGAPSAKSNVVQRSQAVAWRQDRATVREWVVKSSNGSELVAGIDRDPVRKLVITAVHLDRACSRSARAWRGVKDPVSAAQYQAVGHLIGKTEARLNVLPVGGVVSPILWTGEDFDPEQSSRDVLAG